MLRRAQHEAGARRSCPVATTPLGTVLECLVGATEGGSTDKGRRVECVRELSKHRGYPYRHTSEDVAAHSNRHVVPILRRLEPRMGPETIFRLMLATIRPGESRLIVDVGANRGSFALMAAKHGHRVVAFEPVENNIDAFRKYVPKGSYPNVRLVTKGVGARPSSVVMRGNSIGRSQEKDGLAVDVGATVLRRGCDASKYVCHTVEVTTIDTEVRERVFVMKMDIQGFEEFALQGAEKLLSRHGVDVLIIEYDPKLQAEQNGSCTRIANNLWQRGYVLFENSRQKFEADGSLRVQYGRNYGPPLSIAAFVKELTNEISYTDLVAVHKSLVPPGSFFA